MVWTEITREKYRRKGVRHASDQTDEEWELLRAHLPAPRRWGRPRTVDLRNLVDALLYMLWTGCPWSALSRDFPPRSTIQGYFYRWRDDGLWEEVIVALVVKGREALGREPSPTAGVIDSQSVATTESGGPRGIDPNKRIKGRKRHIVTDTNGLLLGVLVHPANVQDAHGAVPLLTSLRKRYPGVRHIFADGAYRGPQLREAIAGSGEWTIEVIKREQGFRGFQLLPRRWVVERTFAWHGRCRRLTRDFEATLASSTAWLLLAHIRLLTRRLARP